MRKYHIQLQSRFHIFIGSNFENTLRIYVYLLTFFQRDYFN